MICTIAILFYNSEKYLSYAVQSVLNQTFQDWELLLIDDGSNDSSLQIAQSFANKDVRIRVISDGENKGLAARLNESILLARGEFYARMDDDDIMSVNRIERQVKFFVDNPCVDVVGSSAMLINENNEVVGSGNMEGVKSGFIHPTVMGKRSWFVNNLYNEQFRRCQDTELWLRTSRNSCFFNIPEPLLFYREFGLSSYNKIRSSHEYLRLLYRNYRLYDKTWLWFAINYIKSEFKDIGYWLCERIGKVDWLISLRKRRQLPKEMWLAESDLNDAIKVELRQ